MTIAEGPPLLRDRERLRWESREKAKIAQALEIPVAFKFFRNANTRLQIMFAEGRLDDTLRMLVTCSSGSYHFIAWDQLAKDMLADSDIQRMVRRYSGAIYDGSDQYMSTELLTSLIIVLVEKVIDRCDLLYQQDLKEADEAQSNHTWFFRLATRATQSALGREYNEFKGELRTAGTREIKKDPTGKPVRDEFGKVIWEQRPYSLLKSKLVNRAADVNLLTGSLDVQTIAQKREQMKIARKVIRSIDKEAWIAIRLALRGHSYVEWDRRRGKREGTTGQNVRRAIARAREMILESAIDSRHTQSV